MRSILSKLIALALLASPFAALPAAASDEPMAAPIASEWRNPSNSVHIRLDRCGTELCGVVSWASPKAIADAKRGGADQLIGTTLFRNLKPTGNGSWKGKVYVPDIQKTFAGTIRFQGANQMVGQGCVLFGLICKAQTWSRVR
ncbi:DUF2147 domain-containing protein [Sphingomonas sp. CJ20]